MNDKHLMFRFHMGAIMDFMKCVTSEAVSAGLRKL